MRHEPHKLVEGCLIAVSSWFICFCFGFGFFCLFLLCLFGCVCVEEGVRQSSSKKITNYQTKKPKKTHQNKK